MCTCLDVHLRVRFSVCVCVIVRVALFHSKQSKHSIHKHKHSKHSKTNLDYFGRHKFDGPDGRSQLGRGDREVSRFDPATYWWVGKSNSGVEWRTTRRGCKKKKKRKIELKLIDGVKIKRGYMFFFCHKNVSNEYFWGVRVYEMALALVFVVVVVVIAGCPSRHRERSYYNISRRNGQPDVVLTTL